MATEQLYNTIHIFGFGVVQVISKEKNVQTAITNVSAAANSVIDNIWANKPADYVGTKEYHAVNIFNGLFADWQAKIKGEKGFRIELNNLDSVLIEDLANAVYATEPAVVEPIVAPIDTPIDTPVVEPPAPDMNEPTT
jgi:hypothetical protein